MVRYRYPFVSFLRYDSDFHLAIVTQNKLVRENKSVPHSYLILNLVDFLASSNFLDFFFLPDFFLLKKKASAAFITNYVTGLNKTYKIFR
jgi:hypothetical protein